MTTQVVSARRSQSVAEIAAIMTSQETGSVVVMEQDRIVGIITERDIIRLVATREHPAGISARDIMSRDVATAIPETPVSEAAALMIERWFRHLPVVSPEGALVGMLSIRDLVGLLVANRGASGVLEPPNHGELVHQRRLARISAGDLD